MIQPSTIFAERELIERIVARNDKDGDGGINFEEFMSMNIKSKLRQQQQQGLYSLSPSSSSAGFSHIRRSSISGGDEVHERAKLAFNAFDRNR